MDKCREVFLEEWKASPFNGWRFVIFKYVANRCFRGGWFNYMGMPVPIYVVKTVERYDVNHPISTWFALGYLKAKMDIEGIPKCDCCGGPVEITVEKAGNEESDE